MYIHEEIKMVLSFLFGENWKEKLFQALEPARNIEFSEPFAPKKEMEKILQAMNYLAQEISEEAWKLGKVLSVLQNSNFENNIIVYGNRGAIWEMDGHEEKENVPFKAVRKNGQWRFYFRHDERFPWQEYFLPNFESA